MVGAFEQQLKEVRETEKARPSAPLLYPPAFQWHERVASLVDGAAIVGVEHEALRVAVDVLLGGRRLVGASLVLSAHLLPDSRGTAPLNEWLEKLPAALDRLQSAVERALRPSDWWDSAGVRCALAAAQATQREFRSFLTQNSALLEFRSEATSLLQ